VIRDGQCPEPEPRGFLGQLGRIRSAVEEAVGESHGQHLADRRQETESSVERMFGRCQTEFYERFGLGLTRPYPQPLLASGSPTASTETRRALTAAAE
jgi:hypothetical protein